MAGRADFNSRVRSSLSSGSRILIAGLALAGVVTAAASVDAASVSLTWTAPTTNADGTPLTDLASYRVYLATAVPSCPSSSFLTVSSPTSAPTAGQAIASRVTALSAGATYFVRISAVDGAGNESACSTSASGVAQVDFSVTPTATTDFGSVTIGGVVDRTFTVQNTSTASISGAASVGSPYSVVAGGSFTLAPGASQVVTVRFRPTVGGTFTGNLNFTVGGDTLSRSVTGSATTVPIVPTFALSVTTGGTGAGSVTSVPTGISCGAACAATVPQGTPMTLTATAASGSTFAGWGGACSGTAATCAWTMTTNTSVTVTFNTRGAPVPVASSLSPASATVGSPATTLTVNGSGFVASSVVRWNGGARATTVVSTSQLRAALTASDLVTVGSVPVSVFTPAPGGGTSGTVSFTITALPSVPVPAAPAVPPAPPGSPSVTQLATNADGATFAISWGAASGAASYRYVAAFNDGSAAQQGTVTGLSFQLRMPYHSSGLAVGGFVCVRSVSVAGLQSADQSCSALPVPARPLVPLVPPAAPGNPSVTQLTTDAGGATFAISWGAASGAASYRYVAAFNDGSAAQQGTVTSLLSLQLRMPYHSSGLAVGGFVCVRSVSVAGLQSTDQSCSALLVPARPPGPVVLPAAPGNPSVTQLGVDAGGATFAIAWGAASGATSYRYVAAFYDGSGAQQGTVTGPSLQLRMPFHSSGVASGGFVCVRSVNAAGQSTDQSCSALQVPSR
jgi:hypothetical protein